MTTLITSRDKQPSRNAETSESYVKRAVDKLGLDKSLVNDSESAMYAWRLNHDPKNIIVAREVLNLTPDTNLSRVARQMADANKATRELIEKDPRYKISAQL